MKNLILFFLSSFFIYQTNTAQMLSANSAKQKENSNNNDTFESVSADPFVIASTVTMDSGPWTVVNGDFDSDGDLDLAVPCRLANTVTILKNEGKNIFSRLQRIDVDDRPLELAVGDVDGDSDLDLAVINWNSSTTQILKNDGSGKFVLASTVAVGRSPEGLVFTDLDHDGDLDLVIANTGGTSILMGNTCSILINNGSGNFAQKSVVITESAPGKVFSEDFDNDGDKDVVVSNAYSGTISILRNDGNGDLKNVSVLAAGFTPAGIVAGDWNKDGTFDLAVVNNGSGNLSIFYGDGNSSFPKSVLINYLTVTQGRSLAITNGDWDMDGDIDLAVTDGDHNALSIFSNDGEGNFAEGSRKPVGASACGITSGDWDGDGDLDLAVTHDPTNKITILKNSTTTTFAHESATKTPEQFSLKQNYPNPFNPSTIINYSIPEEDNVLLTVHDVLGKEMASLVNKRQNAGTHNVVFNASSLSSGIYFYRLQSGSYITQGKMVLLR